MRTLKIIIAVTILGSLIFSSCRDCVEGSGVLFREDRTQQISDFTEIEANGDFDVLLTLDSVTEVIVEGDDNIVPYIKTYLRGDDRLVIENRSSKCFEYDHRVEVQVRTPFVNTIMLNGSGNVACNNWYFSNDILYLKNSGSGDIIFRNTYANFVEAKLYGSGDIELTGEGDNADYLLYGSGRIKAYHYEVDEAYFNNAGSGDIEVTFYDELKGDLSGSGSVYFSGDDRRVFVNITGTGDVIRR